MVLANHIQIPVASTSRGDWDLSHRFRFKWIRRWYNTQGGCHSSWRVLAFSRDPDSAPRPEQRREYRNRQTAVASLGAFHFDRALYWNPSK